MTERIVAECLKSWFNGEPCNPDSPELLGEKFERVIQVNAELGYRLESWQLTSHAVDTDCGVLENETIVAVFVRDE